MICPNCKCEYREGFKHCSDCKVELVNELPQVEENKIQIEPLQHLKIKSSTKYYLLNAIFGFIGSLLFLFFLAIAFSQTQRLPPGWEEPNKPYTPILFIIVIIILIIIVVNVMGIISFAKRNKDVGSRGKKLHKFVLLNFLIIISSFIAFNFIHNVQVLLFRVWIVNIAKSGLFIDALAVNSSLSIFYNAYSAL